MPCVYKELVRTLFKAVVAEIIRGGLNSAARGQFETACSQGFSAVQRMTRIILSQMIATIKDSSYMAGLVTVELMSYTKLIISMANSDNRGTIHVADVFVFFGCVFCVVRKLRAQKSA